MSYDLDRFDGDVIVPVVRAHPKVWMNGVVLTTPYSVLSTVRASSAAAIAPARPRRRRLVPVPDGGQLRSRWEDRPERADAPLLQARPEQDRA